MASAAHRGLFIPELLEYILLHLTEQDILILQRVCRIFRHTIIGSSVLGEQLFLRPARPQPFQRSVTNEQQQSSYLNPLLAKRFWPWYKINADSPYRLWKQDAFDAMHWNLNAWTFEAYAREEASWRRMLVAQPPIKTLRIWRITHRDDQAHDEVLQAEISFPGNAGLRMGTLYDVTENHLCEEHEDGAVYARPWTAFGVYWGAVNIEAPGMDGRRIPPVPEEPAVADEEDADAAPTPPPPARDTVTLILHSIPLRGIAPAQEWGSQFRSEGRRRLAVAFEDLVPSRGWRWAGMKAMAAADDGRRTIQPMPVEVRVHVPRLNESAVAEQRRLRQLSEIMRLRRERERARRGETPLLRE